MDRSSSRPLRWPTWPAYTAGLVQENARLRHEYRLTDKGFDLYPVMAAVLEWGDRYLSDPDGSPVELAHRDCGSPVRAQLVCGSGHVVDKPRDVVSRPGPGAHRRS